MVTRKKAASFFIVRFIPVVHNYGAFSHDVTAAILVFQNNKTAAILVFHTNPMGVGLFSFPKICIDAGHVSENALNWGLVVVYYLYLSIKL